MPHEIIAHIPLPVKGESKVFSGFPGFDKGKNIHYSSIVRKEVSPLIRKVFKTLLGILVAVIVIAVFYVAVVLGQPQENPDAVLVDMNQPLLTASPAVNLASAAEMESMLEAFPVPALYAQDTSRLTLKGGTSYDAAYGSGFARIAVLTYEVNGAGQEVTLQSIYPARAMEFVPRGNYHIAEVAGQPFAGMQSIRMENADSIRLHVQAAEGIYVLTVPKMTAEELSAITRALGLYLKEEN